ncbi:glycosyltransferase family 2 protein, partial [Sphaerospermopsis aphanizomenoides BCCUSP55]|uniref:glycosyltransferase n=1 Tax=Sphaerospermopsis aphanizomenoides TaxID=459663 RepID=UPI0019054A9A
VDNNSNDGTQNYIDQHYTHIKVLQTGDNLGGSGGFSHGMEFVKELEYNYIWLLDNDVRLDSQALLTLVEILQNYPEVGLVGSQIRKLENPQIIHEIGISLYPQKAHLKNKFANLEVISNEEILSGHPYINVDFCSAASLLVRREVVHKIGVFENYFLHFDDVEWCLRAKKAGWVVAANPASIVWHSSPDFKQRPWISYYDERNLCYCWQKHHPELLLKRIRVLLPKLIYYSLTGRFFWVQTHLMGLEDFLRGVKGKMPEPLPYSEYTPEQIIEQSSKVVVQSNIYQDKSQSAAWKELEVSGKITVCIQPKNLVHRIYIWLISCFYKSVDLAIVNCYQPEIYQFNLAKKVYLFTGSGYVLVNVDLIRLLQKTLITFYKILRIYWKIMMKVGKTANNQNFKNQQN